MKTRKKITIGVIEAFLAVVMKMWLNREKRGRGRLYASDQSDICKSC